MLADWRPRAWLLYAVLALGGVATMAAPHLRGLTLPLYRALGLRWGAVASAAAFFFVPLFLLGMTGPFVIRLLSRRVEARRFFGYKGRAVVSDGRRFVEDCTERFDFVVLDAYSGDVLPFHLVTREMFEAVATRLKPRGIVAMNLIADPDGQAAASVFKTLRAVFPVAWAYRSRDDDDVQPLFYFASSREPPVSRRWMLDFPPQDGVARLPYELRRRRFQPAEGLGSVLTDGHNAVDLARAPEALAWRQRTIEELGLEVLGY